MPALLVLHRNPAFPRCIEPIPTRQRIRSSGPCGGQVHAFGNTLVLYQQAAGHSAAGSSPSKSGWSCCSDRRQSSTGSGGAGSGCIDRSGDHGRGDPGRRGADSACDAEKGQRLGLSRDFVSAREAASRALALFRGEGDRAGRQRPCASLASLPGKAATTPMRSRAPARRWRCTGALGTPGEASALHNLAEIYRRLGSPRRALQWYSQAMELHWVSRNHRGEVMSQFASTFWRQLGDETRSDSTVRLPRPLRTLP